MVKTASELLGFRRPVETARRGGPDGQRLRRTEKSDDENGVTLSISEQPREVDHATEQDEHTFTEHIEIAASDLVDRTKELIEEGDVRRLIIRN